MGLFSAVLTAPLAPVRMVLWLAESLATHAEAQGEHRGPSVQERLMEIDEALAAGELTPEQAADLEDELLAQLDLSGDGTGAP